MHEIALLSDFVKLALSSVTHVVLVSIYLFHWLTQFIVFNVSTCLQMPGLMTSLVAQGVIVLSIYLFRWLTQFIVFNVPTFLQMPGLMTSLVAHIMWLQGVVVQRLMS